MHFEIYRANNTYAWKIVRGKKIIAWSIPYTSSEECYAEITQLLGLDRNAQIKMPEPTNKA